MDFMLYSSGIFNGECADELNHGILIVGYGIEMKINDFGFNTYTPYWWIKNSWGTGWGIGGYMKLFRTEEILGEEICGLAVYATYPIV